jgi:hypothetical protein
LPKAGWEYEIDQVVRQIVPWTRQQQRCPAHQSIRCVLYMCISIRLESVGNFPSLSLPLPPHGLNLEVLD